MSDPTMAIVERLKDPSAWARVERGVPVFVPHEREDPDGNPVVVDVPRLERIAKNINARFEQKGVPLVLTEGHRFKGKDGRWTRPPVLSYGVGARVGTWGPNKEPGVLIDQYVPDADCLEVVRGLPFRSPEFYPDNDRITSVALLRNDPHLDMGVVNYERRHHCLLYALEYVMPQEIEDAADLDAAEKDEFLSYIRESNPELYEQWRATQGKPPVTKAKPAAKAKPDDYGDAAPTLYDQHGRKVSMAVPHTFEIPKPAKVKEPDADALHYERRVKELEDRAAALERRERVLVYERELSALQAKGYEFSVKAELDDVADLDRAGFDRHKKRIVSHYRRKADPALYERVPVDDSPDADDAGPADPHRETDTHKRAMDYLLANPGMAYEKAVAHVQETQAKAPRRRGRRDDQE